MYLMTQASKLREIALWWLSEIVLPRSTMYYVEVHGPAPLSACVCRSVHVRLMWSISVFRHCGNLGVLCRTAARRACCVRFVNFSLSLSLSVGRPPDGRAVRAS